MRNLVLFLAGLALAAASPAKSPTQDCTPKRAVTHCVYMVLKKSTQREAEKVVKQFKADGADASITDGNDLSAMLTDSQLKKLLGAKVAYNNTGASSRDVVVCEASIESINPPARYQNVESARIDSACP